MTAGEQKEPEVVRIEIDMQIEVNDSDIDPALPQRQRAEMVLRQLWRKLLGGQHFCYTEYWPEGIVSFSSGKTPNTLDLHEEFDASQMGGIIEEARKPLGQILRECLEEVEKGRSVKEGGVT